MWGEVWKSALGCGERHGKVCWGVGGGEKKSEEMLGEVWGSALRCAGDVGRDVQGGAE